MTVKKASLPHGSWLSWLKDNADALGFATRRTASMLMKAAAKWEACFPFDATRPKPTCKSPSLAAGCRMSHGMAQARALGAAETLEMWRTLCGLPRTILPRRACSYPPAGTVASEVRLLELSGFAQRVAEYLEPGQTVEAAGLSEAQLRELYAEA